MNKPYFIEWYEYEMERANQYFLEYILGEWKSGAIWAFTAVCKAESYIYETVLKEDAEDYESDRVATTALKTWFQDYITNHLV